MSELPKINEALDFIKSALSPVADFAFLLGSFGTERFGDESDIDVAVLFSRELDFTEHSKLASKLEDHFNREVDLVSLNRADPIFAYQVLSTGRLVFSKDDDALLKWRLKQMSLYPDLKMSREIIENNLLKRKRYV